jgi:hypothetical protein
MGAMRQSEEKKKKKKKPNQAWAARSATSSGSPDLCGRPRQKRTLGASCSRAAQLPSP